YRGVIGRFFLSSRRRRTRLQGDWSSDVCSSDLPPATAKAADNTPSTDATTLTAAEQPISGNAAGTVAGNSAVPSSAGGGSALSRSEERRVGKEWRARWWREHDVRGPASVDTCSA